MFNRARELWEGLGRNNQIILAASSLGVLVALIGFIAWASTPEYVPLFSGLAAQDANAISDKLKEANIPFRLAPGGSTIEVPAQNRDEVRMKMLSQGLPAESSASLDYDLLKIGANMGDTQRVEGLKLLRTKESQISKGIMGLQQIASATVQLAPADDSPFSNDKHPASASVFLQVKPGQALGDENVRAIVRYTQMAYTGLSDKNITVVNQQGDLLYDGTNTGGGELANERLKAQHQQALAKRNELQTALDNVIGPHKAVVLVNVELNSDQEETKSETSEPGAVTSKSSETEELNGSGTINGGAPGANANTAAAPTNTPVAGGPGIPTYASTSTSNNGKFKHETTSQTSVPSTTVKHVIKAPGRIEKLTVSALVDKNVPADQVASIENILKTNIGVIPGDLTRQVTVSQITFNHDAETSEAKAEAAERSAENMSRILALAVPLGIMLLTFMLLARALRKTKPITATGGQLALAGGGAGGLGGDLSDFQIVLGPDGEPLPGQSYTYDSQGNIIGLPSGDGGPKTYEVIEEAFDAHLQSILHLTRSKPETVALLVKSWMVQDDKM